MSHKIEIEIKDDKVWAALSKISAVTGRKNSEIIGELANKLIEIKIPQFIKHVVKEFPKLANEPEFKEFL